MLSRHPAYLDDLCTYLLAELVNRPDVMIAPDHTIVSMPRAPKNNHYLRTINRSGRQDYQNRQLMMPIPRITGRTLVNLWRVARTELQLTNYDQETVYHQLFESRRPKRTDHEQNSLCRVERSMEIQNRVWMSSDILCCL